MPIPVNLDIDLYKEIYDNKLFTVTVQIKNTLRVKFGLFFIKLGCKLSGANFVQEFPMPLIQNGEPVETEQ